MEDAEILPKIAELTGHCQRGDHPLVLGVSIGYLVLDLLRSGKISIYTAYQLNGYQLGLDRLGYTKAAYPHKARISTCLSWLNQKLLAHVFEDEAGIERCRGFALEAAGLNQERRGHFMMDQFEKYLEVQDDPDLLTKLLGIRKKGLNKKIDDGPYHDEKFPYDHLAFEEVLLKRLSGQVVDLDRKPDSRFDDLIVALELADY